MIFRQGKLMVACCTKHRVLHTRDHAAEPDVSQVLQW